MRRVPLFLSIQAVISVDKYCLSVLSSFCLLHRFDQVASGLRPCKGSRVLQRLRSSTNYNRCRPQRGKFGNYKDPCRCPGYLYVPAEEERYRETRWIPFTSKFLNSEDPETAAYLHTRGDNIFNDTDVPRTFFKGSNIPIEWMKLAVKENRRRQEAMAHIKNATSEDYHRMRNDGEFGWLRGRRVVPFGDSVDRRAARYVCHEFSHDMVFPKLHETEQWPMGVCHIPAFNLTHSLPFNQLEVLPTGPTGSGTGRCESSPWSDAGKNSGSYMSEISGTQRQTRSDPLAEWSLGSTRISSRRTEAPRRPECHPEWRI
ncbi:hypothetical protein ACKLNR_009212 [Fusarium oxysporum f. sp. zingiberi]